MIDFKTENNSCLFNLFVVFSKPWTICGSSCESKAHARDANFYGTMEGPGGSVMDSSSSRSPVGGDDGHPPLFGAAGTAEIDDGTTRSINLDDIFADCFFGPSPDSLPASTSSMRSTARSSSTFGGNEAYTDGQMARDRVTVGSSVEMGNSGDDNGTGGGGNDEDEEDEEGDRSGDGGDGGGKKRKRPRPQMRQMTEQQKVERR